MGAVKPIIIVGTGRCGSTVFHQMLAQHPDLAWLSNILGKYPRSYRLHRLALWLFDISLTQPLVSKIVRPAEAYALWDSWSPGFRRPMRDLQSDDVTNRVKEHVRTLAQEALTDSRRRFLINLTFAQTQKRSFVLKTG